MAAAVNWLKLECGLDDSGAEQSVEYIVAGRALLGAVPTQTTIIAERFFDESGGMQLVIHAPFGGRINKAWGLALRKRFCRSFNFELQAAATDNGLNISLGEQHSFPLADVFHFLHPNSLRSVLEQAVLTSPLFTTRWRWDAGRALALLRFRGGKKVPPPIQRMRADDLLAAVFPEAQACQENIEGDITISNHPLIREVMKDVLTEAMDIEGLERVLHGIADGRITCLAVDTPQPSQFSHEILNANPYAYLDDAPLEERRARAVEMRRMLPDAVLGEIGRLDPAAIAEVCDDAWPDVRDAEELHDALLTLIALPFRSDTDASVCNQLHNKVKESVAAWNVFFRAIGARSPRNTRTRGSETLLGLGGAHEQLRANLPLGNFRGFYSLNLQILSSFDPRRRASCPRNWLDHPQRPNHREPARFAPFAPASDIDKSFLRLESSGVILRGKFTDPASPRNRMVRTPPSRAYSPPDARPTPQANPARQPAQFMNWLLRWQHVAPSTQLLGERGTLEAIRQLQGYEAPANSWERQILKRRIADFDPAILDQLCLTGAVGWGRLSPHPATLETHVATDAKRRITPTSVAPITFFVREDSEWMIPHRETGEAEVHGPQPRCRRNPPLFATARRLFLRGHRARHRQTKIRSRSCALGTRSRRPSHRGRLRQSTRADRSQASFRAGNRTNLASASQRRPLVAALFRRSPRSHARPRSHLLDASSPLRNRFPRTPHARNQSPQMARAADYSAPPRRSRGNSRRPFRQRISRRAICSQHGRRLFACPAQDQPLSGELITLSAADPLNLAGIIVPGERVAANSGKLVAFRDGVAVEPPEHATIIRMPLAR